jgi:UDP-perosamine 4-acetyltransferase
MDRSAIVVVGGGGHAKVVIEILRAAGEVVLGFTDPDTGAGSSALALRLGTDEALGELAAVGFRRVFVALGGNASRRRIGARLLAEGFELPNAIHPSATISPTVQLGRGVAVMAGAVLNAATRVSDLVVVNTGATVDHDCILGEGCHVAPGCHLSGFVRVGEEALLGVGSSIGRGESMNIGARAILGTGSVVVRDVPEGEIFAGNPARPIRAGARKREVPT